MKKLTAKNQELLNMMIEYYDRENETHEELLCAECNELIMLMLKSNYPETVKNTTIVQFLNKLMTPTIFASIIIDGYKN